jgi:hypothetical protein
MLDRDEAQDAASARLRRRDGLVAAGFGAAVGLGAAGPGQRRGAAPEADEGAAPPDARIAVRRLAASLERGSLERAQRRTVRRGRRCLVRA